MHIIHLALIGAKSVVFCVRFNIHCIWYVYITNNDNNNNNAKQFGSFTIFCE